MTPGGLDLAGVLVPVATPFDRATGELDPVGFRANLRRWLEAPVRGIVLAGSTGEAVLLEEEERRALVDAARDVVPEDRLLVAGTGGESTRMTIRRTREAAEGGVDAVLVQPPAFYRGAMTPAVLRDHYRAIADASPVPVLLYQVPPRFATVELATGLVAELALHPNIVGVKDSRGDLEALGALSRAVPEDFGVLSGSGAGLLGALQVGACGGILGVAGLFPEAAAGIVQAVKDGQSERAGQLQEQVGPLHRAVVAGMGVPGVKVAMDLLGMRGGRPRPPLAPLPEERIPEVRSALVAAGLEPA